MKNTSISHKIHTAGQAMLLIAAGIVCTHLMSIASAKAVTIKKIDNDLWIHGSITGDSPRIFSIKLAEVLLEMQSRGDRTGLVRLHLDIPNAGSTAGSFRLVQLMKAAQSHGTRFAAHIEGNAACGSGCTDLFAAADERWVAPGGKLIFHGFGRLNLDRLMDIPNEYLEAYCDFQKAANELPSLNGVQHRIAGRPVLRTQRF